MIVNHEPLDGWLTKQICAHRLHPAPRSITMQEAESVARVLIWILQQLRKVVLHTFQVIWMNQFKQTFVEKFSRLITECRIGRWALVQQRAVCRDDRNLIGTVFDE